MRYKFIKNKDRSKWLLAVSVVVLVILILFGVSVRQNIGGHAQQAEGDVVLYETTPGAVADNAYTVTVNGKLVFVEKYKDISYARFSFSGVANVTVSGPGNLDISPRSYNIQAEKSGGSVSFSLSQPRKLIVNPMGADKLFIFADALEVSPPNIGDANVIDVSKYVSDVVGGAVETANIQRALDDAAARGYIAYFPKGVYRSGTLKFKSNTSVYLSSGALLLGTGRVEDYDRESFVLFDNVTNVKLFGRGVIDTLGKTLRGISDDDGRVKTIRSFNGGNILVQDIILRDAGSWTVHFVGSTGVTTTDLKIINDMTLTNGDGVDPDSASNVVVEGTFLYTTDDCYAIKTSGLFGILKPSDNILIKNSVCYTKKSALKVGTETKANITNVTFLDDDVVHADRALALYEADGATMDNIKYINSRSEVVGGDREQKLMEFLITNRGGVGGIKNVLINNYNAYEQSPIASDMKGYGDSQIGPVVFCNLVIAGKPANSLVEARITTTLASVNFQECGEIPTMAEIPTSMLLPGTYCIGSCPIASPTVKPVPVPTLSSGGVQPINNPEGLLGFLLAFILLILDFFRRFI